MNEKALELIERLDCITVFIGSIIRDFRLKAVGAAIELADRKSESLEDWQGFIDTDVYPPVLYLTKLEGHNVDLQVAIPERNGLIPLDPEGKIKVKFVFHN